MKKGKKFLAFLLVACLVFGCIGCGKKNTEDESAAEGTSVQEGQGGSESAGPGVSQGSTAEGVKPATMELTGTTAGALTLTGVQKLPADGIGTPGVDFTMLKGGPVSGWDSEGSGKAPYFNPLGSRELYDGAEFYQDGWYRDLTVRYFGEDGYTPITQSFAGYTGYWEFYDENASRNYILYKAREMGAEIYNSTLDRAVFYLQENDTTGWWYSCRIDNDHVLAEYVQIHLLPMGKAVTLTKDAPFCLDEAISLYSRAKSGKQLAGYFVFDGYSDDIENGVKCDLISGIDFGTYRMNSREEVGSYYGMISPREGAEIVVDKVPAVNQWVLWDIHTENWNEDYGISLKVEEVGDIKPITLGEQPGLVKLVGGSGLGSELLLYNANISLENLDAGENMRSPFMDNEGNYCFAVPAGYYLLELGGDAMDGYQAQLQNVPVSAGRITEIVLPSETKAFTSDILSKTGSQDFDAGNMEIISVKDNGSSAALSILVHDPQERDVFPGNEDFQIYENGSLGKVTGITREPAGANVIMCVDSSGSIKKSLPAVIEAACKFVENLPENSTISIIEFKQNLIEHPGNTKEEAIKALKSITAKGDTSLYDAVSKALDRLEGKERAYVIAFTDGVDSREPGDSAPGSAISREDLNEKIKNSNAVVLTMGFGPGHNAQYMQDMAEASVGGQYYAAADEKALDSAFAAVSSKFGNQFTVTYERPEIAVDKASDVPVVSMMMDISGSMNMLPGEIEGDVDIRLDRVRGIFHDLVRKLPKDSLMQFGSFTAPWDFEVYTRQLLTDSKADVLRAIGGLKACGGTPIQKALETAFGALKTVNSSKKVLIFFTDAALEVEDDGSGAQILAFETLLKQIKEEGVRVLFAGLGGKEYAAQHRDVFQHAAELAGGDYIITDSVEEIRTKMDSLLSKVNEPTAAKPGVKILVDLDAKTEDGSRMAYSAVKTEEEMMLRTKPGTVSKPGRVTISDGGPYITYSGETSKLLYGSDTATETVIQGHITFEDAVTSNQFADLKVTDAYIMSRFKGMEAPYGSFLALNVELTFHKKDKSAPEVGYLIPNMFNHCYVSLNNGRMMPVSEATYLAEQPFMTPGDGQVQVNELKNDKGEPLELGETRSGVLIFTVEGMGDWEQLSVHLYDTAYGHLEMALVGALPKAIENIAALPTGAPANIAQSFEMKLTGSEDMTELAGYEANVYYDDRPKSLFRMLEMNFTSKVQALLDIDPTQRFYLSYPTGSGLLLTKMSDVVYNVPLGFTGKTMFAPGSETKVRLPYVIPEAFADKQSALWGEIAGGSFEMPVTKGNPWNGVSEGLRYEHEFFTLVVNQIGFVEDHQIALDFTIIDKKDGEGTAGFDTALLLQRDVEALDYSVDTYSEGGRTYITAISRKGLGSFGDQSELLEPIGLVLADTYETQRLVFGASDPKADWGAYDGQSRRGVLLYSIPSDGFEKKWRLTCEFLPDLNLEIGSKQFTNTDLLAMKPFPEIDTGFEEELAQKVDAAVANYRATHPGADEVEKIGLTDEEIIGNHIETPYLTAYGSKVLEEIDSLDTFYSVMNSLTWIPSDSERSYYAPESVLTQGWGSDADFYILSRKVLMKLGYQTELRRFELSETGWENLQRLGGFESWNPTYVYAIGFADESGRKQIYVPAFRYTIDSLGGMGYLSTEAVYEPETAQGTITVRAYGELKGNAGMGQASLVMAGFADIFGGGDGEVSMYESVDLLQADIDLAQIGRNPMDISFVSLGKTEDGIHDKITAAADTTQGLLKSETLWVNSGDYDFDRVEVILTGFREDLVNAYMLEEGDSLTDIFKSVGVNLPTMKEAAATYYEKLLADNISAFGSLKQTDYGVCRWTTHSMIAKMVKSFGDYEKQSCAAIHGVPTLNGRGGFSFAATLHENNGNADASMDIMHAGHDMLPTKESNEKGIGEEALQRAHNLAMSTYASTGEGSVVKGGETIVDIWKTLPADAGMITVSAEMEERLVTADFLEQQNAPAYLLERLRDEDLERGFILPTAAGKLQGKERWGWMEIDPESMEMISVFDNGERGMAAYIVGLTPKGAAEFTVGAMIGMSCSNFSVAAYALEYEDPMEIMVNSYMLTNYCLEQIKFVSDGMADAKKFAENGAAALAWDKAKGAFTDRIDKDVMDAYKKFRVAAGMDSFGQEPSFADGFEAAMKLYFFGEVDW